MNFRLSFFNFTYSWSLSMQNFCTSALRWATVRAFLQRPINSYLLGNSKTQPGKKTKHKTSIKPHVVLWPMQCWSRTWLLLLAMKSISNKDLLMTKQRIFLFPKTMYHNSGFVLHRELFSQNLTYTNNKFHQWHIATLLLQRCLWTTAIF